MKTRWLTAAAVVLALSAPLAAQQQQQEFEPNRVPGWAFVPGFRFGTIYDSNIGLATPPADTGQTAGDQLFVAAPFGQLEYFGRRTEFTTRYSGSIQRYTDVGELNSFDHSLNASLRRAMTRRVSLYFQTSFSDVPTTDEVQLNGVPFSRSGAQSNTFAGTIDARLTRYTDLMVRYENTWIDFDVDENFLTGGWLNGVRAEWSRRLNARSSLGAEYGFRFADMNDGLQQMTFHDVGATFRHTLSPFTTFTFAGGISRLSGPLPGETHDGPYVRGSISRSGERVSAGASFDRQFVPSFGFGGSNQSQEISGFVRMPLARNRTYVQGSATWRRSDPLLGGELKLDTIWLRSTLGYAVTRWFRTEAFYAYTRQDSEVTGGEIDRQRIGVQVVVSQPMRIR